MIIGIDFDGTCVTHEFPKIGKSIGAEPVLRKLVDAGHKLILFTMRSDKPEVSTTDPTIQGVSGKHLSAAVEWFKERNIPLWGVNENPEQKSWTDSPKAYCHLYIDDAALGAFLVMPHDHQYGGGRPYVDWPRVEKELFLRSML